MSRVVCFGEIMMRLNPEGYLKFLQAERFEASYAGGEANVAVSLANFGHEALFVTRLPAHEIGQCAVNALRKYGVVTTGIVRGGDRLGVYYVEKGASQRGSKVIYDRANSAIALAKPSDFDWDAILNGADWFHFTGITPALGGELPRICEDALRTCKRRGVTVSCDINYRSKLWPREKAREVMGGLVTYADVLVSNEEDAKDVFGIEAPRSDIGRGVLSREGYEDVARQLAERFGCKWVAITLRGSISASENTWAGMLHGDGRSWYSSEYRMLVVDRVGGGDSFCGALVHALLRGMDAQAAIDFAAAASCLKHSIEHDFNLVSESEVLSLAAGNASGRVQR